MTPFGMLMRELRTKQQQTLASQASFLGVSPAYLSALEHGKRGKPSHALVDQICVFFDLIWDEAETIKLAAQLSHPKPVIDASQLSPEAVRLANALALNIDRLSEDDCAAIYDDIVKRMS